MPRSLRLFAFLVGLLLLAFPLPVGAREPQADDDPSLEARADDSDSTATSASGGHSSHGTNPLEMSPNMFHVANRPPTPPSSAPHRTTHSDLAFHQAGEATATRQDLAAAGNYDGFRLFNVSDPENPIEVANVRCRGPQNDVSFYRANNRLLLIQSIDRPQTNDGMQDQCATSADTPISRNNPTPPFTRFVFGFEGLRIWDVTRPQAPRLIAAVPTACGSHTHTTIPDKDEQRALVYVSSYPIGASVSPEPAVGDVGPRCTQPHARISVVEIPDEAPEAAHVLKEQPLDADTRPFRGTLGSGGTGAIGCHDITVMFEANQQPEANPRPAKENAGAACLEEGQLWDISDPENPTTVGPGTHTHIYNPFITPANPAAGGLFHTASFTWDGEILLFTDEWQGGGAHGCDGPEDTRGNVWFYKNVQPGAPAPLYGRYMMPRAQPAAEICTLHNGNVIPTNEGYFGVSSSYEGGTTVFDFSNVQDFPELPPFEFGQARPATAPPLVGREVAYADLQSVDGRGKDDTWSSYWWNDYIWVNGGLVRGRADDPQRQRGFDVFKILLPQGKSLGDPTEPTDVFEHQFRARKQPGEVNPQTQEVHESTGWGQGNNSTSP